MTGPRPAGRSWTRADDDQLRAMLEAGTKANAIAKKLKRTVGAIYSRAKMIRKISDQQKAEDKINPPLNRLIQLPISLSQPLPPGGSIKTASLPRQGKSAPKI
jgi:hypothetical protein